MSALMRVRKTARQLDAGLVWVEAYLPLDVQAFAEFSQKVAELGSAELVAKADPDLARRALDPVDSHGEAMLREDLVKLAHGFLEQSRKMDVQHDENARSSLHLVESFMNGPEIASPNFAPGAWVVVFKCDPGSAEWAQIEKGELNAVSFQAWTTKVQVTIAEAA